MLTRILQASSRRVTLGRLKIPTSQPLNPYMICITKTNTSTYLTKVKVEQFQDD